MLIMKTRGWENGITAKATDANILQNLGFKVHLLG